MAKFAFWSDSVDWFRPVLSSTGDSTYDLNLVQVDPNWSLVRLMKSSTFGLGLRNIKSLVGHFTI